MIKERMMQQAQKQLGEAAEKGFKVLQDKINRVNEQNDMIIDTLNEMMKSQIAIWKVLESKYPEEVMNKVQKDLKIKMEVE